MDGTEIGGTPDLPLTGTASYNGLAFGAYGAKYGTDFAGGPEGTEELGEFEGEISLTADFGARNISGRVENIDLAGFVATQSGEVTYIELVNSGYELVLGATPFGSDGAFTERNVRLIHPNVSITSEGSWGGRFSTVDDSAGNPRRVAGTVGASGTTPGGSAAEFVGAFYGNTPQFEADVSR